MQIWYLGSAGISIGSESITKRGYFLYLVLLGTATITPYAHMVIHYLMPMAWLGHNHSHMHAIRTKHHYPQIVHMGDHAYNEGDEDERRADAYMAGEWAYVTEDER
jgi:hypothetical protein